MDLANWVSRLDPGRTLLSTCIPCSRDSASHRQDGRGDRDALPAVTQSGDFTAQLDVGVRYFDVRCKRSGERIVLHRGSATGAGLEDVLRDQFVPWSASHPKEVIFLDIGIDDRCEEEVVEILGKHIQEEQIAIEYFDARTGDFRPDVTWGDLALNHRRFVITWSSRRFTANSPEQLGWSTKAEVQRQRLFGDWSGPAAAPTLVNYNGALVMCLLDSDGAIYVATSADGLAWPCKSVVEGQRLFGDWSGVRSTPTLVVFKDALIMCLLDSDGAIYVARSTDGETWQTQQDVQAQRLFGDWRGVGSTPTLVVFGEVLVMCLLDHGGGVYVASSRDGRTWQSKDDVVRQRLFGDWRGVGSTPTLASFKGQVIMALLSHDGAIHVARSGDGSTWQGKDEVVEQRHFGDWKGVRSSPTLAVFEDQLFMCVMDSDGGVYLTASDDGLMWPAKSDLDSSRLFGDWAGVRTTPALAVPGAGLDGLIMCLGDREGGIYAARGSQERASVVAWLSYSDRIRWSPCDDLAEKDLGELQSYLMDRIGEWRRDRMFVLRAIDAPLPSPLNDPASIERDDGAAMNAWTVALDPATINVVMRDFVNDHQDAMQRIVDNNDASW